MPERIGDKLEQFKFEHDVSEGLFISNKTYAITVENGIIIMKVKGVTSASSALLDFKDMFLKSKSIQAKKTSSIININFTSFNSNLLKLPLV